MIIAGQSITSGPDHLVIDIQEPYWGAYKEFGWKDREPGLSLSKQLIQEAIKQKKDIGVVCRGNRYTIPPKRIIEWYENHKEPKPIMERNGIKLIVVRQGLYDTIHEDISEYFYEYKVTASLEEVKDYHMPLWKWNQFVEKRWNYPLEKLS